MDKECVLPLPLPTDDSSMCSAEYLFFSSHAGAIDLYERLRGVLRAMLPNCGISVKKTQISFSLRRTFAVVSFLPLRKISLQTNDYITVSFGLPCRCDSPCICAAVKISERRWTHHVIVRSADDINAELFALLREAAAFSGAK